MAADKDFLIHVMDLLSPLGGISSRAMFGGHGIYHEGDIFALITDTGLHFKVNETNLTAYQEAGSKQFKPMPYYEVPGDVIEDTAALHEWAKISISVGHATGKKKKKK
ncbi:TfoX/Sxy family protein [Chloroflexota bacterium]